MTPIELNSSGHTYEESVLLHAKDTRFNLKGKKEYVIGELLTFISGRVTKEFKLIKCKYNSSKNTTFIKGIVL